MDINEKLFSNFSISKDSVKSYLDMVKAFPLLSNEEEINLFNSMNSSDDKIKSMARNKIFMCNLRLVLDIVQKYKITKIDFLDLVFEGNMGLLLAIDRFDISKGFKFSTYATWWIRHTILLALNSKTGIINYPYKVYKNVSTYNNFISSFEGTNGRKPSRQEISEFTGFSIKKIKDIEKYLCDNVSLNNIIIDDEIIEYEDCIGDDTVNVEEIVNLRSLNDAFCYILDFLGIKDRYKEIFILKNGLDGNGIRTSIELSKVYGVSCQAINQVNNRILNKIRSSNKCLRILSQFMPNPSESFEKMINKK